MARLFSIVAAAAICCTAFSAHAQVLIKPNEKMVSSLAAAARQALPMAIMADGSPVPPESAEELAQPIVPAVLDAQTVQRGLLSAEMAACELEWESLSFQTYMDKLRSSGRYSDKQLAYTALLHGLTMQLTLNALTQYVRSCSRSTQRQLTKMAATEEIQLP